MTVAVASIVITTLTIYLAVLDAWGAYAWENMLQISSCDSK